jgi:hypothetical protein
MVGQGRGISDTNLFVKIDIYFRPVIRFLCVLQLSPTIKFTIMIQVTNKHYHIQYRVRLAKTGFKLTTLVVIGTDCI